MMWIIRHRNPDDHEIFKLNSTVVIHSSFTLKKLVMMCHVPFHVNCEIKLDSDKTFSAWNIPGP